MEIIYSVNDSWYAGAYKDKKAPCKAARPFSIIHPEKSDKAVLCIHGYTGYPGEVVRPARDLYEAGFDIYAPRLPGHGTSGDDFSKIKYQDLISVPIKAAKDLLDKYKEVYIFGHSMGGGISLITAQAVPGIKRIAVGGPGIVDGKENLPAKPSALKMVGIFKKRIPNKWQPDPEYIMYYEDAPADDLYLGSEYWSWLYPKQLCALFEVMVEGGKAVYNLDIDILTISGGKDTIIGDASSKHIIKNGKGNNEHLHLKNATHYMFYDKDKSEEDIAVDAIVDWFTRG